MSTGQGGWAANRAHEAGALHNPAGGGFGFAGFPLAEVESARWLPAETADLKVGTIEPGAGEGIVLRFEHSVESEVVHPFLQRVTAAVSVTIEVGLAAGESAQELVQC